MGGGAGKGGREGVRWRNGRERAQWVVVEDSVARYRSIFYEDRNCITSTSCNSLREQGRSVRAASVEPARARKRESKREGSARDGPRGK